MANYSSDIMINNFIINFNHIGVRCMKTQSNECKKIHNE